MKRQEIVALAEKAGFERLFPSNEDWVCFTEEIERFYKMVVAAERQALAKESSATEQPAQQCRRELQSDGDFVCDCKPKECLHLEQIKANAEDLAKLGWQSIECPFCGSSGAQAFPKPTSKPWVELTEQEIGKAYDDYQSGRLSTGFNGAVRSLEAKLKEKNT